MRALDSAPAVAPPWAERRRRARELAARWPHAAEMLRLYAALLDVQEPASRAALERTPGPRRAGRLRRRPRVSAGGDGDDRGGPAGAGPGRAHRAQLAGRDAGGVARRRHAAAGEYLARASAAPVLEALGPGLPLPRPRREGGCPHCGGRPQLSYLAESADALLTAPRRLSCARCSGSWIHERLSCPGCGEQSSAKRPSFSEDRQMPALQVDACGRCRRYLIAVDLRKDPGAVPVVDELVALPLDLYARERGFTKMAPNLMGI